MRNHPLSFVVGTGTVAPSTFVKQGPSTYQAQQAGVGDAVIGIAQEGGYAAPVDGGSTAAGTYRGAAGTPQTGDPISVYALGDVCLLTLGSTVLSAGATAVTVGKLLASDASGNGVVATATQYYGAQAMEAGIGGDLIRVQVQLGQLN